MPFFNQIMNVTYKYTRHQSCKPLHNVTFTDARIQPTTPQTHIILFTYIAYTCARIYMCVCVCVKQCVCVCVCVRARVRVRGCTCMYC